MISNPRDKFIDGHAQGCLDQLTSILQVLLITIQWEVKQRSSDSCITPSCQKGKGSAIVVVGLFDATIVTTWTVNIATNNACIAAG